MKQALRAVVSFLTIQVMLLTPLLGVSQVKAEVLPSSNTPACNAQQTITSALASYSTSPASPTPTAEATPDPNAPIDPSTYDPPEDNEVPGSEIIAINQDIAAQNPFFDQTSFTESMQSYAKKDNGYFDASSNTWYLCSTNNLSMGLGPTGSIDYNTSEYFSTLGWPLDRITFDNALDKYALTGEPCTLYKANNTCDETMITTPDGTNPDGTPKFKQTPKYYSEIWDNGHWDAPKADARILQTLVYLVTPTSMGGAGEESIEVGRILQSDKNDTDFTKENTDDVSSHYYDQSNPEAPSILATGVDITGIGQVRITTKTVQHHRIGSDDVSYQYNSVPIKVAYQTDQGAQSAGAAPSTNILQGALGLYSSQLGSLLSSMGLNSNIDLSKANLTNFSSVAQLIGKSLVSNLLNSPTGSLDGWNLDSVLDNMGRAFIAQQLGLPANSLAYGDTSDDVIRDIGQLTFEKALNLPTGSLSGNTSDVIWGNVGRRFLEDSIGVSPNTLETGKVYTQTDFLQRIGAGYMEQKLSLNPQSLQTTDWSTFVASEKAKILCTSIDATYVDGQLNMGSTSTGSSVDNYGFGPSDFEDPVGKVINNHSQAGVARFLQIVGDRALQLSLGKFISTVSSTSGQAPVNTTQGIDFVPAFASAFGLDIASTSNLGGNPSLSDPVALIVNQRINNKSYSVSLTTKGVSMENAGFSNRAQNIKLAGMIIAAQAAKTFVIPGATAAVTSLVALHNLLSSWTTPLQTASTLVNSAVNQIDASIYTSLTLSDTLPIQQGITTASGLIQKFDDALTTSINASGQSGISAALGLPGTYYNVDPTTGAYTSIALTTDPGSAFLKGDVSSNLMQLVGRVVIGNRLASNVTAQQTIAGLLKVNTSTSFSTVSSINTDISVVGAIPTSGNGLLSVIDPTNFSKGGLQLSDFERVFTKNLAPETFDRVGEEQLLSAAWNLYAVPAIGNSTTTAAGQVTNTFNQIVQDINFYATRINDIQSIGQSLTVEIESATNISQPLKDQLKALNTLNIDHTIVNIQSISAKYEAAIGNIPPSQLSQKMQAQVTRAIHDMQEIAAGHSLSFSQTPGSVSGGGVATNSCLLPSTIQGFFKEGQKGFGGIAKQVAACQIDVKLGLPYGSFYGWYQSKTYTLDSLELVVGKLFAKQNNLDLTDDQAKAKGAEILEASAVNALIGQIPGLSTTEKNLGIGPQDIVNMFTGNTTKVLENLGGKMMDRYFNWSPGTAIAIIDPQCYDTVTKLTTTCSGDMATQVRENALASAGLKQLGITLNFPASFNLFDAVGDGDFVNSFGNSSVSESLGLAPNSFTGSFADVRKTNDPHTLLTAFSWYDSQAMANLTTLLADISKDPDALGLVYTRDEIIAARAKMSNLVLDEMAKVDSPIWTASPSTLNSPALLSMSTAILNAQAPIYSQVLSSVGVEASGVAGTKVMQDIATFTAQASGITNSGEVARMANQSLAFVTRVFNLDQLFKSVPGKFKDFITSQNGVTADDLAKNDGAYTLGNILTNKALGPLLKGTPFAALIGDFNTITTITGCGTGMNIGAFILGSTDTVDSLDCLSSTSRGFSLQTLLGDGVSSGGTTGITTNGVATSNITASNVCATGFYYDTATGACLEGTAPASQAKPTQSDNIAAQKKALAIRNNLLNAFLSSSAGMSLEKSLDLEPGTLKAIALKPQDAPAIAIDQGLRIIGSQLLGVKPSDIGQDNTIKGMYLVLSQSILAGYCPVDPNSTATVNNGDLQLIVSTKQSCSTNFNAQRALGNFQTSLVNYLGTNYNNGTLPKEFGLADIGIALAGGTQGIYLDALARMAAQTNSKLGNSPEAKAFYINFNDIRAATGFSTMSDAALDTAGTAQAAQWIRGTVSTTDINLCPTGFAFDPIANQCVTSNGPLANPSYLYGMTDAQVVAWYNSPAADSASSDPQFVRLINSSSQFNAGRYNMISSAQHTAQQRLQYALMDAAAFEIDPHVPVGFSHAMLAGSSYQRAQMLGEYVINVIYSNTSFLKNIGLSQKQADDLFVFATNCFSSAHNCTNIPASSLAIVDNWINRQTGLGLPSGVSLGLIAWATTGFDQSKFNVQTIQMGGVKVPSAGILLENWGLQKIFTWADKQLGFQVGSAYQIYTAGANVIKAAKVAATANTLLNTAQAVESDAYAAFDAAVNDPNATEATIAAAESKYQAAASNSSVAGSNAGKANANLVGAEAAGVALIINTVFKSQISDAEQSLGLVPGTGAIAVSILTSLAFGAAVPWAEIAIFIALNLFGVYKIDIFQHATADGYFPFTGHFGELSYNPQEFPSSDPQIGEFEAKNRNNYQNGLEQAAQAKVFFTLQDLLVMPERWGAANGIDPNSLWIPQIYTARQQDVANLDYLISAPAPWQVLGSYGYGSLADRAFLKYNADGTITTTPTAQRAGVFYDPTCSNNTTLNTSAPPTNGITATPTATATDTPATTATPTSTAKVAPTASSGATPIPSSSAPHQSCIFGDHIMLRW